MSEEDITLTASLATEIWSQHYTPIIGAEQVHYMLAKFQSKEAIAQQIKEGYLYFHISSTQHYGYLSVKVEEEHLFISKIYVKQESRGMGLGKNLMQCAIGIALEHNLDSLRLTVNKTLHRLYQRTKEWDLQKSER